MIVESRLAEEQRSENVDVQVARAPRRQVAPPPLVREMPPAGNREGLSFLTIVAIAVLAGMAHLTGAPIFITVGLLATGIAGLFMHLRSRRAERRAAALLDETTARNRAEIETLADRMWEMQESEERFHGLIDALGDLVVHRDRDGHIVYANKVFADLVETDQRDLAGKTLAELGIDVGVVPDAAFSDHECLSSTDVAIRAGPLRESRLVARKLGQSRMVVVAAPSYLAARGMPRTPVDLAGHNLLTFGFARHMDGWPFVDASGVEIVAPVDGTPTVSDGEAMRLTALSGAGLARLARWHVEPDIEAGRLVPLLEDFNPGDPEPTHAVYVGQGRHLPARVRAFLDFLAETVRL